MGLVSFFANRVLAMTCSFESGTENSMGGHCLPLGADAADGLDEVRRAVRRRIAAGADIIKFYADYRRRIMRSPPARQHPYRPSVLHPPADPNPDVVVFPQEDMDLIVAEAKMAQCPVAAQCLTLEGAVGAIKVGAQTIEHAVAANDEMFHAMTESGCIFVPTSQKPYKIHVPSNSVDFHVPSPMPDINAPVFRRI